MPIFSRVKQPWMGIFVFKKSGFPPFSEQSFFRKLCQTGEQSRLQVYVFTPGGVSWSGKTIVGYRYSSLKGRWVKGQYPFPHLIYDRCFFRSKVHYLHYRAVVSRFRENGVDFLGYGLKGKWDVLSVLKLESSFHPHLPSTEMYRDANTLLARLKQGQDVFLKPRAGSHGKGAFRIGKRLSRYVVNGRDHHNRIMNKSFGDAFALAQWLKQFTCKRKYIVQTYLNLTTRDGHAFDIRAFMQKNRHGRWELTGMGVRRGKPGSVTSNLHGGGAALQAEPFLSAQFGNERKDRILKQIRYLSYRIPPVLEQNHGRLVELGIDLGVDRSGHVWILEVNSKPGRDMFNKLSNTKANASSVSNLIDYARYLLDRKLGG